MAIYALGINHKTAPVALREQVAFAPEQVPFALRELAAVANVTDAVILSTCNRTELYFNGSTEQAEQVIAWLSDFHQLNNLQLQPHLYLYQQQDAASHLMRVAAGLDSLVLGEPQILGQVKQAYNQSRQAGTINPQFERLFQKTFAIAKQVRTETDIGANAVSVAFVAVSLAKQIFGQLDHISVLLIGAGETIELVARHLKEQGATRLTVANRTYERGLVMAEPFGADVVTLAQVPSVLNKTDIVISSTASTLPIVGKGMVEQALKARRHKPMFLVDLAVPRDIETQVADLDDAYLYTVDDLQTIIAQNRESRQQAAQQAELIIDQGVAEFQQWQVLQGNVDWVRDYRQQCEQIKNELLAKAVNQLVAGQEPEKVMAELATKLSNRLMHSPTKAIRHLVQEEQVQPQALISLLLDL